MAAMVIERLHLNAIDELFCGAENVLMEAVLCGHPGLVSLATEAPLVSLNAQSNLVCQLDMVGKFADAERITRSIGLANFGAAGSAIVTAPTLRVGLNTLNALGPLVNLRSRLSFEETRSFGLVFTLQPCAELSSDGANLLLKLDALKLSRFLSDVTRQHDGERNSSKECLGESLRPVDEFCRRYKWYGKRTALDAALPGSHSSRHRQAFRIARRQFASIERKCFVPSVQHLLRSRHSGPRPSLQIAADHFGLSTRTFRRKLANDGTNFNRLVNDI